MNNLLLHNDQTAKFLYLDEWHRPVYRLEDNSEVCCVNLNGTYLCTLGDGHDGYREPGYALKDEYQPKSEIPTISVKEAFARYARIDSSLGADYTREEVLVFLKWLEAAEKCLVEAFIDKMDGPQNPGLKSNLSRTPDGWRGFLPLALKYARKN